MIILATAIILSLNSSNIVEKAKEATSASDLANAKNVVILAKAEWELMTESERTLKGGAFVTYAESKLKKAGYSDEFISNLGVNEDGTLGIQFPKIPEGFVVSIYEGETEIDDGMVIYETDSLEGVSQETAMTSYNQFVWIPVKDINDFVRVDGYSNGVLQENVSSGKTSEPFNKTTDAGITLSMSNDLTGEWAEYTAMYNSVKKYKGFYVGRYEAGTSKSRSYTSNGNGDVFIQKDKIRYDFVCWGQSMTDAEGDVTDGDGYNQGKGAVELSRNLYNTNSIKSTLMYGVQWDAIMKFFSDIENPNVEGKKYIEDSTGMGWYCSNFNSGNPNKNTGIDVDEKASNMVKNIYDMAGNMFEWTMEAGNANKRVVRGGCWMCMSYPDSVSSRGGVSPGIANNYISFRPCLYLL